jgi:hypothetical protein
VLDKSRIGAIVLVGSLLARPAMKALKREAVKTPPLPLTDTSLITRIPFTGGDGVLPMGETRMSTTNIPYIDPNVQHVGISRLRSLNATQLREIDKTLVIQENDQPLAVLLKYEEFLIMQQKLMSVLDTISVMADDTELAGIMAGLKEMSGGQTKSITEIRAALKTKKEKV